ncbi:hypothetical protein HU230_0025670 [Bradyrhizobium quebecense]|uniref:Uncharacterized protein n=1 Tax=Bradyrhizobium quebecense TaxID=2748629 RepID=A0A973WLK3_9BRAD|nr:hypothetical protein [Bradyrhizobium quebecense]UGA41751.1 hypothetical protein HU230_0025670 [Bradyrhizobium quebecense]
MPKEKTFNNPRNKYACAAEECSRAGEPVDLSATGIAGRACAALFKCKLLAKTTVKTAHTRAAL